MVSEFLPTPPSYYDTLLDRVEDLKENINLLSELGILVDSDENDICSRFLLSQYKIGLPFFMKLYSEKVLTALEKVTLKHCLNQLSGSKYASRQPLKQYIRKQIN